MNEETINSGNQRKFPEWILIKFGDIPSVIVFETLREMNKHIRKFDLKPHGNIVKAGQGFLELPSGETCMIIRGNVKILRETAQYRLF